MGTIDLTSVSELTTIKISELPEIGSVVGSSVLPVVESGSTYKITEENLNNINASGRIVFIDANFTDNEDTREFSTIQAGIDFAYGEWGDSLESNNKAVVLIYPGKYTEQIHSYPYIVIMSQTSGYPTVTIYNTGADSSHYPLRSNEDEKYEMVGISIDTDASGVIGKLPYGSFTNCRFKYGDFVERNSSVTSIFRNCEFYNGDHSGFNLTGTNLSGYRNILLKAGCLFEHNRTFNIASTHDSWANFQWDDIHVAGSADISGDWAWAIKSCKLYRLLQRSSIDTAGAVSIVDSSFENGLHFTAMPLSFKMINSSFLGSRIPDGEADITSDVTITGSTIKNVTMHNGLSGKIQTTNAITNVGADVVDGYFSLQDAIDSIVTSGKIRLYDNFANLAELIIPNNTNITIDGLLIFSLSFTGDIVELSLGEILHLEGLDTITGGTVEINGNGAEFHMHSCIKDNVLQILATSGTDSKVHLRNTNITGSTGNAAIQAENVNTSYTICNSRLIGATGRPAFEFGIDADNTLRAKFSTFIHGDGGVNVPIDTINGYDVDLAMYSCGLNASLNPAKTTNTIGSAGNIIDDQINF